MWSLIVNDTIQSGIHDFLLTFHSSHLSISHHFRDKRRFPSKIANISHPSVFNAPLKGFPWNFVSAQGFQETRVMVLSEGRKSFKIGLAILIQYRSVTASQPATHPASHVAVAITLNAKASSLKTICNAYELRLLPAGCREAAKCRY